MSVDIVGWPSNESLSAQQRRRRLLFLFPSTEMTPIKTGTRRCICWPILTGANARPIEPLQSKIKSRSGHSSQALLTHTQNTTKQNTK